MRKMDDKNHSLVSTCFEKSAGLAEEVLLLDGLGVSMSFISVASGDSCDKFREDLFLSRNLFLWKTMTSVRMTAVMAITMTPPIRETIVAT